MTSLIHITTVPDMLAFFTGQVGYMKDRGFEVAVIASPGKDLEQFAAAEKISAYAVTMTRRITPLRDLVVVGRLWRRLSLSRPQIVHSHTPKGGLLGMIGAWLARVPVRIYQIHGLPLMTATGPKRQLLRWTEKVSCALSHHVLCDSHSLREVAVTERLCPGDKIQVLLGGSVNGVDAEGTFSPARLGAQVRERIRASCGIPAGAVVAGSVMRLVRDKGVSELVAAWAVLREEFPNLHLLVVGVFEPQDPVPPKVEAALRSDPRIHLTGFVSEVAPYYAAMDVVVLPTYREGLPIVPLEAAAMELPVVATLIPGCVDAIKHGLTGTLVPVRDAAALADAMRTYLCSPELRRKHGKAGRERVLSEFRQEAIWEALYLEYERLLRANDVRSGDSEVKGKRSSINKQRSVGGNQEPSS